MNNDNNTKLKKDFALKIIIPVLLIGVVVGIWVIKNEQKNTTSIEVDKPGVASTDKPSIVETEPPSANSTNKTSTDESANPSIASTDNSSTVESQKPSVTVTDKQSEVASDKSKKVESKKSSVASTNKPSKATSDKPSKVETEKPAVASSDKPSTAESDSLDFALHVTEKIDLEKLKSYGLPIIIDFGADSCIPCKQMAPVLKELNEELQGKAIIKFVNVWKYRDLAEGYPISLIPTQILIDANGKPYIPKDPEAMQLKLYTTKDTEEHVFTAHEGGITKEQLLSILKEMGLK